MIIEDVLGLALVMTCQRMDCDAKEVIPVEPVALRSITVQHLLDEAAGGDPEYDEPIIEVGWGADRAGLDWVWHCPEHRSG